ncbi:MAG: outer membrane beta-barrel protein, partial [Muribaculaceae bacterium]|nr:outer membrane beta-barrel protein [Muribaculaceae bacterium]
MKKVYPYRFSRLSSTILIGGLTLISLPAFADEEETPELDETQLDELVVVQQQKLVSSDGATLTYNVTEDPEAGSSNILDILRKVPGVTVDAEDNVKVNGQSNFQILMNGREDPMLKGDIKTILKSLPAASIKKIEVISEPGAKYDAEGVGGILNIVTDRKTRLEGFYAQAGAWVNAYQVGGYLTGRKRFNKVMLDARVSYNNGNVWPRSSSSERSVESLNDSANHLLTSKQKAKNGWDYTGVNLNMSWEPDSLNLFTLSANYGYNTWGNHGEEDRQMQAPDLSVLWRLRRNFDSDGKYNSANAQVSYQHNFGRDDHNIVASYMYWFGHMRNITNYLTDQISGQLSDSPFYGSRGKGNYIYNIIQVDYSNRFSPKHLLEAGAKIYLNHNGSDDVSYYGSNASDAVDDQSS